jgi:prepilin-type processing-associated H-X9-DG protein
MVESAGAAERKGCGLGSIIVGIVAVCILAALCIPLLFSILEETGPRAYCANNLKQIGTACQVWATSHRQAWPKGYGEESTRWDDVGNTRADAWSPIRDDPEPPAREAADNKQPIQSNTASLWLPVAKAGLSPDVFLCDKAEYAKRETSIRDFTLIRDFRGESYCTYSYQNVLGQYRLHQTAARISTQYAVAADANPMRRDFWSGAPGGGMPVGITNKKLAERPAFCEDGEEAQSWNREVKFIRHPWELNSPNHGFKGQHVLYLDGHVEWRTDPYCGTNYDNIWLRRRADVTAAIDPKNIESLRAHNDEASYDGKSTLPENSKDDSFLVP